MFFIVRINYKGQVESHSIETRETVRDALIRFHNIIAADLSNSQVTYSAAYIFNDKGRNLVQPFVFLDENETEFPFEYSVLRTFNKNNSWSNSVEYKENLSESQKRFYNIIAADLQDSQVGFNFAAIITAEGAVEEVKAFSKAE